MLDSPPRPPTNWVKITRFGSGHRTHHRLALGENVSQSHLMLAFILGFTLSTATPPKPPQRPFTPPVTQPATTTVGGGSR